jgi:hypothetical protein
LSDARAIIDETTVHPTVCVTDCQEVRDLIRVGQSHARNVGNQPNFTYVWVEVKGDRDIEFPDRWGRWLYLTREELKQLFRLAANQALNQ